MPGTRRPPLSYAEAMHPYSSTRRAGGLLFVSGQLGVNVNGDLLGELVAEAHQAIDNLRAQLDASGASIADVVKVNVYLANISDRHEFDLVYADCFPEPRPARTCIQAGALPFGARVEIEAIAGEPPVREAP